MIFVKPVIEGDRNFLVRDRWLLCASHCAGPGSGDIGNIKVTVGGDIVSAEPRGSRVCCSPRRLGR